MLSISSQKYVDDILNTIKSYNNVHDDKVKFDLKRTVTNYHVHYDLELYGNSKAISSVLSNYNY